MRVVCTTCGVLMFESKDGEAVTSYRYCDSCSSTLTQYTTSAVDKSHPSHDIMNDIMKAKTDLDALPKPIGEFTRLERRRNGLTTVGFRLFVPDEEGMLLKLLEQGWQVTGIERDRPGSLKVVSYLLTRIFCLSEQLYAEFEARIGPSLTLPRLTKQ